MPHWCCRADNLPSSSGCESSRDSQKMMAHQCNTSYNSKGFRHVKGKWMSWASGAVPLWPHHFVIYVHLHPALLFSSLFFFFSLSPAKAYSPEFYYDTPNPTLSQKQSKNYSYVLQWTQKEPNAVDPILKYRLEVRQVRSALLEPRHVPLGRGPLRRQLHQRLLADWELKVVELPDPDGLTPSPPNGRDRPSAQLGVHFHVRCWVQSRTFRVLLLAIDLFVLSVLKGLLMWTKPQSH